MSGFIKINGIEVAVPVSGPDVLLGRVASGAGPHEEIAPAALTEETAPAAGDFLPIWTGDGLRKVDYRSICVVPINAQTGTTYTLALSDLGKMVTLSNASAITLTVPPNSSEAFPVGAGIDLAQIGAGQVTVAQGSGVTVNATPGLKFRAQYAGATLRKTGTDTWLLFGDLAA